MAASTVQLIDASGRHGSPGGKFGGDPGVGNGDGILTPLACERRWYRLSTRSGQAGENGHSAGHPSAGAPGTDIAVRLSCSQVTPTAVQLFDRSTKTYWEIAKDQTMVLKADGGDGGDGGRGEDGEDGGRGRDGTDASRFCSGTSGGRGGRGGDGGHGTSGADGGQAGNITVDVDYDDTDLLLPLSLSVKGAAEGRKAHMDQLVLVVEVAEGALPILTRGLG
ncbi:uncharacterized protein PG998_004408 [Apiospora kogelbergensis]|uniref:uncharacterized protein n=1 Tax=Apiospora kogelbergensis TaxID=1337665 RepID=UPI00312F1106